MPHQILESTVQQREGKPIKAPKDKFMYNVSVKKVCAMRPLKEDSQQGRQDIYDHCDFSFKPPMRSISIE